MGIWLLLLATIIGVGAGLLHLARPDWFARSEAKRGGAHGLPYFRRLGVVLLVCGLLMGGLLVARLLGVVTIP